MYYYVLGIAYYVLGIAYHVFTIYYVLNFYLLN